MKIAIVGVTGLVGTHFLKVLEELNFPVSELIPVASLASVGKTVLFKGEEWKVVSMEQALEMKPQIALFSAGSQVSKQWAPEFVNVGSVVIDNSSCWRMYPEIPLVVPEVNGNIITKNHKIIANPNCSTIQLVAAVWPLHQAFHLKRMVVSTYQSVTGTGQKAVEQMKNERNGENTLTVYPHKIDMNCFPHGGSFLENGYTTEEQKLVDESRKIMQSPDLLVSPTVVRIPVDGGHSESVNLEFNNSFEISEVYHILKNAPGIVIQDNPETNHYPMPLTAKGKNEVFVGRIRRDETLANGLNMWIVADNLRKGAATNAVQIAQYLITNHLI